MIAPRAAAKVVRCTQDYILRLAREGKIAAVEQAGCLFIGDKSFRTFLVERARKKDELRAQLREARRTVRRLHDELARADN